MDQVMYVYITINNLIHVLQGTQNEFIYNY